MSHPPSWGIWAGHCWKPSAPLRRGFLLNGRIWICEWPGPASTGGRYEHKPMQRLCPTTQVDRQVADLTCCTCCTLQQRATTCNNATPRESVRSRREFAGKSRLGWPVWSGNRGLAFGVQVFSPASSRRSSNSVKRNPRQLSAARMPGCTDGWSGAPTLIGAKTSEI